MKQLSGNLQVEAFYLPILMSVKYEFFEFSFERCIAICAFLVPASLLLTLWTILLARQGHSPIQIHLVMLAASLAAFILLLHDFAWFAIGVVMAPTYILLVLSCACLSLNLWAIADSNGGTFAGTGAPARRNDATA